MVKKRRAFAAASSNVGVLRLRGTTRFANRSAALRMTAYGGMITPYGGMTSYGVTVHRFSATYLSVAYKDGRGTSPRVRHCERELSAG